MKFDNQFLICFLGIDGSGKTTLASRLNKNLMNRNVPNKLVYGRLEPFFVKPMIIIGRKIFLKNKNMILNYKEYSSSKERTIENHGILYKIYLYIFLLDYVIQIIFRISIPYLVGKSFVCDRYVYDTIITDLYEQNQYSESEMIKLINNFFLIAPKPRISFLIDVSEEIAFNRKNDTPSIDYLIEKRKTYLKIAKKQDIVILDGSKSFEELNKIIHQKLIEKGIL